MVEELPHLEGRDVTGEGHRDTERGGDGRANQTMTAELFGSLADSIMTERGDKSRRYSFESQRGGNFTDVRHETLSNSGCAKATAAAETGR